MARFVKLVISPFHRHTNSESSDISETSSQIVPFIEKKSELVSAKKKKKWKCTRRPSPNISYIPSLRILKRDIRRSYVTMFANVINSHDYFFLKQYLNTFLLPDASLHHCKPPVCFIKNGKSEILKMFATNFIFFPDTIMTFSSTQVCVNSHEKGSKIISKMKIAATQIYVSNEYPPGISTELNEETGELINYPKREISSQPISMEKEGIWIMRLDENNYIQTLEVHDMSLIK
jgi:hypothetical protein